MHPLILAARYKPCILYYISKENCPTKKRDLLAHWKKITEVRSVFNGKKVGWDVSKMENGNDITNRIFIYSICLHLMTVNFRPLLPVCTTDWELCGHWRLMQHMLYVFLRQYFNKGHLISKKVWLKSIYSSSVNHRAIQESSWRYPEVIVTSSWRHPEVIPK